MKAKQYPSQSELQEWFRYENGKLFWKKNPMKRGKSLCGVEAISKNAHGYYRVCLNGQHLRVHRIIWILLKGNLDPSLDIDHINGERADNRIENLRPVTPQENQHNLKRHREGKKPNQAYVHTDKRFEKFRKPFSARQSLAFKKQEHLGSYATMKEAQDVCDFVNSGRAVYLLAAVYNQKVKNDQLR